MNGSLDLATSIAFTWSPNPKIFKGISPNFQFHDTLPYIKQLRTCSSFIIYPELNKQGNIHYHGLIHIMDKVKWYKKVLPTLKYKGFVLIKSKIDEGWLKYIEKEKSTMESILEISLPLDNSHNLFKRKSKQSKEEDNRTRTILDFM